MVKIGLYGASGKMAQSIISCLKDEKDATLSVAFSQKNEVENLSSELLTNDFAKFFEACDVIIDFSQKEATVALLNYARTNPKPLVIGTTGLSDDEKNLLHLASGTMPILYATNMSLGVAVLNRIARIASKVLREFDIEIVEQHHRHKKDAPSGTAITLAGCVAEARDLNLKDVLVTGRAGMVGARSKDEIAVMALRGGDVVGRHTVGFYNDGEFIELNHTATSRATFSKGAIKAAIWLKDQGSGLYSIDDSLGLDD